jgi:hypothetical protein
METPILALVSSALSCPDGSWKWAMPIHNWRAILLQEFGKLLKIQHDGKNRKL